MFYKLNENSVLVDEGPMRITISVWKDSLPCYEFAYLGGKRALEILREISPFTGVLKQLAHKIRIRDVYPSFIKDMINSAKIMDDVSLTPLAAVAGTVADSLADFVFQQGADKVIVDNGGDIAIRLKERECVRLAIKTSLFKKEISHYIQIFSDDGIGGIATSGFGGRSFTKGIASAVTVFAEKSSIADAGATVIGNSTDVPCETVKKMPAEDIYPDTDIKGQYVTSEIGKIPEHKKIIALENGYREALRLFNTGIIKGTVISIGENVKILNFGERIERIH